MSSCILYLQLVNLDNHAPFIHWLVNAINNSWSICITGLMTLSWVSSILLMDKMYFSFQGKVIISQTFLRSSQQPCSQDEVIFIAYSLFCVFRFENLSSKSPCCFFNLKLKQSKVFNQCNNIKNFWETKLNLSIPEAFFVLLYWIWIYSILYCQVTFVIGYCL